MTHNTGLDWKIYETGDSFSVFYDSPSEGFWFNNRAEAENFRSAIADNPNLDPFVAYWKLTK